jgi:hypothetical protein
MTHTITPQPFRIPIGTLSDDGVHVIISPEWFQYLTVELFSRVGGTQSLTQQEIIQLIADSVAKLRIPVLYQDDFDDTPSIPGPPGKDGKDGLTTFIHIYEDAQESEPYFMRIP